jgi:hypothetical protein
MDGWTPSGRLTETVKKGSSLDKATRKRAPMQANGGVARVVPGSEDRARPRAGRPGHLTGLFSDEPLEPFAQPLRQVLLQKRGQIHGAVLDREGRRVGQSGLPPASVRKSREGGSTFRIAMLSFSTSARQVPKFLRAGQPVISVDTKKEELVGDFTRSGKEWYPKDRPEAVRVHDLPDLELGKGSPL